MRALVGTDVTVTVTWRGQTGEPAPPAGPVAVSATRRSDGTAVPIGAPTTTGARSSATIDAADAQPLDILDVSWAAGPAVRATTVRLVGAFCFDLAAARGADVALADASRFPDELLLAARDVVEEEAETITGQAFTPRLDVLERAGDGRQWMPGPIAPREVRAATLDGVDVTDRVRAIPGVIAVSAWPAGAVLRVALVHGLDGPPDEMRWAMLIRLRHLVTATRSGVPDRAVSFTVTEGGTFQLAAPGPLATGVPEVDAVYRRHRREVAVA